MSRTHAPRRIRRSLALGITAALAVGLVTALAPAAQAETIGTLTASPVTGTDTTPINFTANGTCDGTGGDYVQLWVKGPGFPVAGARVSANYEATTLNINNGGYVLPLANNMAYHANKIDPPVVLNGAYTFTLMCHGAFDDISVGDYVQTLYFKTANGSTTYTTTNPFATTTTVSVTPATAASLGASVQIKATVAPSAATGSVQFKDGGVDFGSPVTVTSGVATLTTTSLALGAHSFTAAFTPTGAYEPSTTTAAVAYTINALPAPPTNSVVPSLSGTARVGYTLSCRIGTWSGATKYTYAWLRNGAVISGRTTTAYTLTASDYNRYIQCRVTASNAGGSLIKSSSSFKPLAGVFKNLKAPYLTSTPRVGVYVKFYAGSWSPRPGKYTYQWLRDGRAIAGATSYAYKPKSTDKKHKLQIRVTVSATSYYSTYKISAYKVVG